MLSSFRRRRKPGRTSINNKNGLPPTDTIPIYEDEQPLPPKGPNLSTKKSLSVQKSTQRQSGNDLPPALPPRVPVEKKNSVQMSSIPLSNDQFPFVDETSSSSTLLAPTRILPSKEISTSLVDLMGTATDSVTNHETIEPIPPDNKLRKHSVFSFFQRISTAPATTVDRLGLLDSLANISNAANLVESPTSHRVPFTGAQPTLTVFSKTNNEFTWCYESSSPSHVNNGTSFDECLPRLEIDDKPLIYRQQFEPTEHFNWYGISESHGPVVISYKYSIDQNKQRSIMSIVRTRQGTTIESLCDIHSTSSIPVEILRRICEQCAITDIEYFDPVLCDGTHELLLKYDESHVSNQHKFGIIYQRENQLTEEDIFSNETASIAMENFLKLIGSRVKLKDFRGFRGGLDVKSDHTGTESVYEQFHNHEIMFHVSTLLPYSKSERQQLERKRHIGNDIVAIVFQESETTFNPECITSQFIHAYLVVTPVDQDKTQYKVSVIHRDTVPPFGPPMDTTKTFQSDQIFKNWILTKLINAEMASCRANTIQKYHERTRMNLFDNLYRTLHEQNRPVMNYIFHHSQYKHECDIEQQQQQREETQNYPSSKNSDNSLLGSVRRRLIAPKLRMQNPHTDNGKSSPGATVQISTPPSNNSNDSRSKTRSMTMDLRRSVSRESMNTNGHTPTATTSTGRMTSFFSSSSKTTSPRLDKSRPNRSLLDPEGADTPINSRTSTKYLSPSTCPSSPWSPGPIDGFMLTSSSNEIVHNGSSSSSISFIETSYHLQNKSNLGDSDHHSQLQFSADILQSTSRDDLIKYVLLLQQQQQHLNRLSEKDQSNSKELKRLEM